MAFFDLGGLRLWPEVEGARHHPKVSYPVRYGRFGEIVHPRYRCRFNRCGEIRFLRGRGRSWPHANEWLKRTPGNDWLYYATAGYADVHGLTGEYYLPCLPYPSNSLFSEAPFELPAVADLLRSWPQLLAELGRLAATAPAGACRDFLARVRANSEPAALAARAGQLRAILQGRLPVLPPDCRHVDYEVIPLLVADGCLYNCGFCEVKAGGAFAVRDRQEILAQLQALKTFFGPDLVNYNGLFLGQHDGLAAGADLLSFAATVAYETLGLARSHFDTLHLFCFGSVDSLLAAPESCFESLAGLPFQVHVNIGFESADPATLAELAKPVTAERVTAAFQRMLAVNRAYPSIEVSGNFILGEGLPDGHPASLLALLRHGLERPSAKGAVYLSPLRGGGGRRALLHQFRELKRFSRLPAYLYLIQRLL